MKTVVIEDIRADNDYGLIVQMPEEGSVYQEDYFYWKGSSILTCFQTNRITTGTMMTMKNSYFSPETPCFLWRIRGMALSVPGVSGYLG